MKACVFLLFVLVGSSVAAWGDWVQSGRNKINSVAAGVKENVDKVKDQGERLVEKAKASIASGIESQSAAVEQLKEKVQNLSVDQVKEQGEQLVEKAKASIASGIESHSAAIEQLKEKIQNLSGESGEKLKEAQAAVQSKLNDIIADIESSGDIDTLKAKAQAGLAQVEAIKEELLSKFNLN